MGKLLMNSLAANSFIFILFMRQIPVASLFFSLLLRQNLLTTVTALSERAGHVSRPDTRLASDWSTMIT